MKDKEKYDIFVVTCPEIGLQILKSVKKNQDESFYSLMMRSENSEPSDIRTLIRYKPGVRLAMLMVDDCRDVPWRVSTRRPSRE